MEEDYHKYPKVKLASKNNEENLKNSFLLPFSRLIAGTIDRDINITIFIHVLAQRFKRMYFSFEIA